jgi:hypothetical protein
VLGKKLFCHRKRGRPDLDVAVVAELRFIVVDCQRKDWIERHKFVCDEAKRMVGKEGEAEYFMKMIQDPNIRALMDLKK